MVYKVNSSRAPYVRIKKQEKKKNKTVENMLMKNVSRFDNMEFLDTNLALNVNSAMTITG